MKNLSIVRAIIAGLILIAVIAIAWSLWPRASAPVVNLPTLDYTATESWATRPTRPPPAVWEAGWDVDVVLLTSDGILKPKDAAGLERARAKAGEATAETTEALSGLGDVYTPYLRPGETGADMSSAFATYTASENRGRAFLLATDLPLPDDIAATISADPLLRDRFAGLIVFGGDAAAGFAPSRDMSAICSRRYTPEAGCTLTGSIGRKDGKAVLEGEAAGGGRLIDGLIPWLDDNAARLAEPLGELEEIEIIDIKQAPEGE